MVTSFDSVAGNRFGRKTNYFHVALYSIFLSEMHMNQTHIKIELNYQDFFCKSKQIEISASEEVLDIFFVACIDLSMVQM